MNCPGHMLSEEQTKAMRQRVALEDDVARLLSGGPVPLAELAPDGSEEMVLAVVTEQRLALLLKCVRDAEKTLEDARQHPRQDETPERLRRLHGEVVRCREELHRAVGEALMLRAELERRALHQRSLGVR